VTTTLRERLGLAIQKQRQVHGLTQSQLARLAKLSLKHVGEIERGEANASMDALERLTNTLEWDPFELPLREQDTLPEGVRTLLLAELTHMQHLVQTRSAGFKPWTRRWCDAWRRNPRSRLRHQRNRLALREDGRVRRGCLTKARAEVNHIMGELRLRGKRWWSRYYRNGKRHEESAHTAKKTEAARLLKLREGDIAKGVPVTPKIGRFTMDEAMQDVLNDYRINGKRSLGVVERRIRLHLLPYFSGRRMVTISTADVRAYVAKRQADVIIVRQWIGDQPAVTRPVSNAEINRELTILKRGFSLAMQAGKLLARPHIPLLQERNARAGFFERDAFDAVRRRLPAPLQPVVTFAYITGWRIPSEVLRLEWSHVDFVGSTVRLDGTMTKNGEPRTVPNDC
jgi:transcriptional regulator with XRE-family HTH domain